MQVSKRITRAMTAVEKPSISAINAEFETLKLAEETQKEVDRLLNRNKEKHGKKKHDNQNNQKNSQKKNMCRIKGHDHEWKECPDNPRSKPRRSQDRNRESHATERRDVSQNSRVIE